MSSRRACQIVNSTLHPETGEELFFFGRLSAYVALNVPITGAMLLFGHLPFWSAFFQFVNQSKNMILNHVNGGGVNHHRSSLSEQGLDQQKEESFFFFSYLQILLSCGCNFHIDCVGICLGVSNPSFRKICISFASFCPLYCCCGGFCG